MAPFHITPVSGGVRMSAVRTAGSGPQPPPAAKPPARTESQSPPVEVASPPSQPVGFGGDGVGSIATASQAVDRPVAELSAASVRFERNEDTGDMVILVVDRQTEEVIRVIPPDELARIAQSLKLRGLLINSQG